MPLAIDLRLETPDTRPSLRRWLPTRLGGLATLAGVRRGRLSITVVNDAAMTRLHARYKRSRTTTDVLTFDLRQNPGDPIEGDLVLCRDQAARQAKQRGHTIRQELLLYALHGLLHLQGYDDLTPARFRQMHRREDELLAKAGLKPLFQTP